MDPVYLDHNATTPMRPAAIAAVAAASDLTGNASSVHAWGRRARSTVEDARESVAALVGAKPDWVVFTAGGTEANNLALRGVSVASVAASAVEHPSVLKARSDIREIPVDANGVVGIDAIGQADLVSVMLANNETGVVQPVARVAEIAKINGALVHCDAVQAAGRMKIAMTALGADLMSLSAHKIGGPQGVGALIVRPGVRLDAVQTGGGQERGARAGTENVAGIAGFGAAAAEALSDLPRMQALEHLRNKLEAGLRVAAPEVEIFGVNAERLSNTSCIALPAVSAESQLMVFDLAGVMVSSGSACSSGKVAKSHVLQAMGVADDIAETAIRVSLGWTTTEADIDRFIAAWTAVYRRTQTNVRKVA
jgi:cysteine desulfurase